jgi:hypothetical protein
MTQHSRLDCTAVGRLHPRCLHSHQLTPLRSDAMAKPSQTSHSEAGHARSHACAQAHRHLQCPRLSRAAACTSPPSQAGGVCAAGLAHCGHHPQRHQAGERDVLRHLPSVTSQGGRVARRAPFTSQMPATLAVASTFHLLPVVANCCSILLQHPALPRSAAAAWAAAPPPPPLSPPHTPSLTPLTLLPVPPPPLRPPAAHRLWPGHHHPGPGQRATRAAGLPGLRGPRGHQVLPVHAKV